MIGYIHYWIGCFGNGRAFLISLAFFLNFWLHFQCSFQVHVTVCVLCFYVCECVYINTTFILYLAKFLNGHKLENEKRKTFTYNSIQIWKWNTKLVLNLQWINFSNRLGFQLINEYKDDELCNGECFREFWICRGIQCDDDGNCVYAKPISLMLFVVCVILNTYFPIFIYKSIDLMNILKFSFNIDHSNLKGF